jgi:hypothetical protein
MPHNSKPVLCRLLVKLKSFLIILLNANALKIAIAQAVQSMTVGHSCTALEQLKDRHDSVTSAVLPMGPDLHRPPFVLFNSVARL